MSRVFEGVMDELARKSGYGYDELVDIYNDAWQECEDAGEDLNWDYFVGVTMEHDW